MTRALVVDKFKTFIESEWDTIRKFQNLLADEMDIICGTRMPKECCGVLFYAKRAIATNRHWLICCECKGYYGESDFFFYNYEQEDVMVGYNPFIDLGFNMQAIKGIFFSWKPYLLKLRIDDIIKVIHKYYKTIKEQRRVQAYIKVDKQDGIIHIMLHDRDGNIHNETIKLWFANEPADEMSFSINCGYLAKLLKIIKDFDYHIVDICFDDTYSPVILKGINKRENKVPIKIAVGQYFMSK